MLSTGFDSAVCLPISGVPCITRDISHQSLLAALSMKAEQRLMCISQLEQRAAMKQLQERKESLPAVMPQMALESVDRPHTASPDCYCCCADLPGYDPVRVLQILPASPGAAVLQEAPDVQGQAAGRPERSSYLGSGMLRFASTAPLMQKTAAQPGTLRGCPGLRRVGHQRAA